MNVQKEKPFRLVMTVFSVMVFAIRIYYQKKSKEEGGEFDLMEGRTSLAFAAVAALTNIIFGLAFLIRPQALPWSYLRLPSWLRWMGAAILGTGQLLLWAAHHHLAANFSGVVGLREEQEFVNTGPYAKIRHPIYTAYLASYIGGGLLAANWVLATIPALCYAVMAAIRMPQEEALLSETFGEKYETYMLQSHRLLPRIY